MEVIAEGVSRIGLMMQMYLSKDPSSVDVDSWFSWKEDRIEGGSVAQSSGAFASTEEDYEADRAANLAMMRG